MNNRRPLSITAPNEQSYPAIALAGFDSVDLPLATFHGIDAAGSDALEQVILTRGQALRALGLSVAQTHLTFWPSHVPPIGDGSYEDYQARMLPVLLWELELTEKLGCHVAVMHPFFIQDGDPTSSREGGLRLIDALLPTLERLSVTLAIENIYGMNGSDAHHSSTQDLLALVEHFSHPLVGVCLDTGHALIRGQSPVQMAQKLGKHLKALHLHTTIPPLDMHTIPYAINGDPISWRTFAATLNEIGYVGAINLETRPHSHLPASAIPAYYQLAHDTALGLFGS